MSSLNTMTILVHHGPMHVHSKTNIECKINITYFNKRQMHAFNCLSFVHSVGFERPYLMFICCFLNYGGAYIKVQET